MFLGQGVRGIQKGYPRPKHYSPEFYLFCTQLAAQLPPPFYLHRDMKYMSENPTLIDTLFLNRPRSRCDDRGGDRELM